MDYKNILVETAGNVGIITLNRPEALNALSTPLLTEIRNALQVYEADESVGAIVITGSEKAFAAGADIREMQGKNFIDCFQAYSAWDTLRAAPRGGRNRAPVVPVVHPANPAPLIVG